VERALGGWGFQVGDQGAGSRIGREALEEALLAYDGVRPASPLAGWILASFGNDPNAVVEFSLGAKPGDYGNFAPKVLEHAAQGDVIAGEILARAVAAVEASLAALGLDGNTPLSLLGGLSQFYAESLSEPFRALVRPPRTDALGGAVSIAVRTFGTME
jgi:glucosamine kinase